MGIKTVLELFVIKIAETLILQLKTFAAEITKLLVGRDRTPQQAVCGQ